MQKRFRRSEIVALLASCGQKNAGSSYLQASREIKAEGRIPSDLKVVLTTFQIYLNQFFGALSLISFVGVLTRENSSPKIPAMATLFPALANDGYAMLTLCANGFDVQARSLLRNFVEKLDLTLCVLADERYASGYVDDSSFEGSRQFFFSKISKGRLKERAKSGFIELFGAELDIVRWLQSEWREELDLMLGAAVHPNHTVGFISLFPHSFKSRGDAVGLGGHTSNNSIRTILEAMRATLPLAVLSRDKPLTELVSQSDINDEALIKAAAEVVIAAKFGVGVFTASWAQ